jgi:hypothetical protein
MLNNTANWIDRRISIVNSAVHTDTYPTTSREVLTFIRSGRWARQIMLIRQKYNRVFESATQAGDSDPVAKAKAAVVELKRQLPALIFSGWFEKRADKGLREHSGILCLDVEKCSNIPQLRDKLQSDPYVQAAFVSSTGSGLKILVRIPPDSSLHRASFLAAQQYFRKTYSLEIDNCPDLCRLCFVSIDPLIFIRPDDAKTFAPFETESAPKRAADEHYTFRQRSDDLTHRVLAYLAGCPPADGTGGHGGHPQTLKVATQLVIGFNLGIDGARPFLREYNKKCVPPWNDKDLEHKLAEAAKNKLGREPGAKFREDNQTGMPREVGDDWQAPSGDKQTEQDKTGAHVESEQSPCPYDPVDWEEIRKKVILNPTGQFVQKAFYPLDSILTPYMKEARACCEAVDIYLLGAILPVCARLLARRVYVEWGMEKLYPNVFKLLVGTAGMRKTSAIRCAKRVAWNCLPPEAFLSSKQSVEALFAEYCTDEGGCPDKLMLVEEGNALMATWAKSEYGARVAAEFLQLYDCCELTESFMRNKSGKKEIKKKGPKRIIPETSTSVVIGGTFGVATFPLEQVKEGIERRFMYEVAETLGRTIHWPERLPSSQIADQFKPLIGLSGEIKMPRQGKIWDRWVAYQEQNRKQINEAGSDNEVLAARLTSAPSQVVKIAMIYEACRAVHAGWPMLNEFTLEGLELAICFVDEHLRAAAFLDRYGIRKAAQERAEVILATVRRDFRAQRPDTIFLTRTEVTRKFCTNIGRAGSLTPEDLYLRIIPDLERQGEVTRVVKRGKFEVYAFRTEFNA